MNKVYNDVRDFMMLGQPDMVSSELRTPEVTEGLLYGPEDLRDLAHRMVDASKNIRVGPAPHATRLGLGLMLEELGEAIQAAEQGDLVEFADGLADLVYVTAWTALAHGIDLPAVWSEVQRSNLEKFPTCVNCEGSGRKATASEIASCVPIDPTSAVTPCSTCSGLGRVVIRDPSGKVQKPRGWTPPDIKGVLERSK